MLTRTLTAAAFLAALTLTPVAASAAQKYTPPPASFSGQWFTTADGCSYSRAKAPGYAPTWHLIQNPHHIGGRAPHRGCPVILRTTG